MAEIRIPQMDDGIQEVTVSAWLMKEGDSVMEGDPIVEVETDRATIELEAFETETGTLTKILVAVGETVSVGDAICIIASGSTPAKADNSANPVAEAGHGHATPSERRRGSKRLLEPVDRHRKRHTPSEMDTTLNSLVSWLGISLLVGPFVWIDLIYGRACSIAYAVLAIAVACLANWIYTKYPEKFTLRTGQGKRPNRRQPEMEKPTMSEKQRSLKKQVRVVWGGIIGIVVAFLFPPRDGGRYRFSFIGGSDYYNGRINSMFLLVEVILICLITAGIMYTVRLSSSGEEI